MVRTNGDCALMPIFWRMALGVLERGKIKLTAGENRMSLSFFSLKLCLSKDGENLRFGKDFRST